MMMKKLSLPLLLVCIIVNNLFSQEKAEKTAAFQLSFIPPLSTQGLQASEYTNAVSFNIIAGVSKNITVFSLSSIGAYVSNDLKGTHISGIGTYAGNNGDGFMMSGIFNKTKDFKGFQLAGINNIAHDVKGGQLSGVMNVANDISGIQISSIVNKARNVKGLQFAAILNIAETNDYPVGLINIIRDGEMSIGATYNEIGSTVVSFRSGGRIMYGILGIGYNHKAKKEQFVVEGGIGAHIPVSNRFRINNEIKSQFLTKFSDKQTDHVSLSIMPAFRILPQWEIFGGPSINYLNTDNPENKNLFPKNNIWKKYTNNHMQQAYFGFSVGTHFLF